MILKFLTILNSNAKKVLQIVIFVIFFLISTFSYLLPLSSLFQNLIWVYYGTILFEKEGLITNIVKKYKILILFAILVMIGSKFVIDLKLDAICALLFISAVYGLVPNSINDSWIALSKYSFGIYLFHSPLIYITYSFFNNKNPLLVVFLNFIVFGVLALLLSMLIDKTKARIIIGNYDYKKSWLYRKYFNE